MKYCTNCIIPDTRPGIVIEADGVCNACRQAAQQRYIDWPARRQHWQDMVAWAREQKRRYDCIIPVSGGKDSTWQTVTCLESGLRPLAVTWKTPARTELGRENLQNLINLGVDHIDFSVNPTVERAFMLATFRRAGSPAIPMHLALFNIPLTVAVALGIPLIVWGENSAVEYGGTDTALQGAQLTAEWLAVYGVSGGTTAADWVTADLPASQLAAYQGPSAGAVAAAAVRAVFLGHYFPWDPATSRAVAAAHGFRARTAGPKTGYYNYADIDDDFISIHHLLKWYKFGFTRLFDNLSLEIRRGRMSRSEAIDIVRQRGHDVPEADISAFCAYVGLTATEFFAVCERFRNPAIWTKVNGVWQIPGFLIKDWHWS